MSAWTSPRAEAIRLLRRHYELDATTAPLVVDQVFANISEPDRDMLAAGAAELAKALPPKSGKAYCRNLAGVVWRAMLERAR